MQIAYTFMDQVAPFFSQTSIKARCLLADTLEARGRKNQDIVKQLHDLVVPEVESAEQALALEFIIYYNN